MAPSFQNSVKSDRKHVKDKNDPDGKTKPRISLEKMVVNLHLLPEVLTRRTRQGGRYTLVDVCPPHPLILKFRATNKHSNKIHLCIKFPTSPSKTSHFSLPPVFHTITKKLHSLCLQASCSCAPWAAHFHERTPTNPASHYQEWPLEWPSIPLQSHQLVL